ncbi:hypothetical protein GCM10020229_06760 [Kitasatospora albolonga]|uniref:serine protease n=1 Tax=Kitasatospora albolonga TaxID=68173 RepID=UPI0031E80D1C
MAFHGELPVGAPGPHALNAAVLRIRDLRGEAVGLGFLVSPHLALTCAHVVSAVLGTPDDQEPAPGAGLHVDLPLSAAPGPDRPAATASVEAWLPPLESGGGDVAVLRLDAALPGAAPVRLVEDDTVWGHPVRAFGFPAGRPGGVWHAGVLRAGQSQGLVQVDLTGEGYPVSRGFSGTPVWDEHLGGVVGMMAVAEPGKPSASYLIPASRLLASSPGLRELALPPSPFRSLTAFQEADAALFHGRQEESDELARALDRDQWVTLVGGSGAGKSSLALAGVVPRLRAEGAAAVVVRPTAGSSPLAVLAAALLPLLEPELSETQRLLRLAELTTVLRQGGLPDLVPRLLDVQGRHRLVVVVDQFEELLALAPRAADELATVLFTDALPPTVRVLTTLRADFLEAALAHPVLGPALSRRVQALGPLSAARLREVVTTPVDAVPGVRYEPALVDRILADAGAEPGTLPLLGFTLDLLWQRQRGGLLSHQAYRDLGGVTGALSEYAGKAWDAHVPEEDLAAARRLFTQLVRVPLGSPAVTRRPALRGDLGEREWRIAQRLAGTRLLVTSLDVEGAETVELAHEALITGWERLAAWAAEDRSFLEWRETLRHDMDRWEHGGRSPELLPTTAALETAGAWLAEHEGDLTPAERSYLATGSAHRRSRRRRARVLRSAIACVVVAVVTFATLFAYARRQSEERDALATSRALTQASQDDTSLDPARSVMLALAAYRTAPTQEARSQLLRTYLAHSEKQRMLSGLLGTVQDFQTSRDGNVVLAVSRLGRATLFVHALTGDVRITQVPSVGQVFYPLVSADGKRAGYVQEDGKAAWFPVDQDASRPMGALHRLPSVPGMSTKANHYVRPSMSLDGRVIVSRVKDELIWWDLDRDAIDRSTPAPADREQESYSIQIGPDNRSLLEVRNGQGTRNNQSLLAWDPTNGTARTVISGMDAITLSGDRTAAVVCHRPQPAQAVLHLVRVSDGGQVGESRSDQDDGTAPCSSGVVTETGTTAGIVHGNDLIMVDLLQGKEISRTPMGRSFSWVRLVSANGRLFHVTDEDSYITFADLSDGGVLNVGQQALTNDGMRTVSILADGSAIQLRPAIGDNSVLLAEAKRREPYWEPSEQTDLMKFDRTGALLATREGRNVIVVRDASTLGQVSVITAAEPPARAQDKLTTLVWGVDPSEKWDFSYHFVGTKVTTISGTLVQQWDPRTGRELVRLDVKSLLPGGGPEGTPDIGIGLYDEKKVTLVVWGDPEVRIVDITTGTVTETVKTTDDVLGVQFEPSGRYLGLLRRGAIVELWQRHPLRRELGPLRSITEGYPRNATITRFIDDEGRFMVASNNSIRIYRVGKQVPEESYEFGPRSDSFLRPYYSFPALSRDAGTVIYIGPKGHVGSLRLDPALWQRDLCRIIGNRQFTDEERASLPARVPTEPLCADH